MKSKTTNSAMAISRRTALVAAGTLGATALIGTRGAIAQDYPSKPITIVVAYPAGGSTDVLTRVLADQLTALLGVSVIVENRPGGGGMIGAVSVARSQPDGYTFLVSPSGPMALVWQTSETSPFNAIEDFTPVASMHKQPLFLFSRTDGGYGSLEEIIAAHKEGKQITIGLSGHGNTTHYCSFFLGQEMGIDFIAVPYSGGAPMIAGIVSGEVDIGFLPAGDAKAQFDGGAVRALLVTSEDPSPMFPDVPTLSQFNLTEPQVEVWMAIYGPRGLPEDIVVKVGSAVSTVYETDVMDRYLAGSEKMSGTAEEVATYLASDIEKYRHFIEASGFLKENN